MRKIELIDLCKHYVGQVDKTSTYHPVVIEHTIARVMNTVLYEVFRNKLSELDLYTKTVTLTINDDGVKYCNLTDANRIMQFPGVGDGVRSVYPTDSLDTRYYPVTVENALRIGSMEYNEVTDDVPYVVKNTRIEFVGTLPSGTASVKANIVRPFESYTDNEEFYIPAGQDEVLFTKVVQLLSGVQPPDLRNDNNGVRR